ncbi:hypothetical protein QO010_002470 [Caulobacter ginsengisoli]|uniref:DUF1993 domain-containing protein n=1 Tax=Caulobacter ginsengisoli TaxID=400775 RepID=A0ABU0ITK2_9CAUL|nr:DUF1993 domain-containing protein [Caulobacter ginsengisoli]MDQ0464686.1 hypothetical protein [Caulobacter ginsengisoli]
MSLSLYDVSIPVYQRMLGNLASFLDKAEAHAKAGGPGLETLAEAKLIDDMASFTRQIQLASDAAKGGAARFAQQEAPSMPDTETTFAELRERIAKTQAFLASIKREDVDGGEGRTIELKLPNRTMTFTGTEFLTGFSLPNFLFHVTTAYAILRAQGVPLGKMDFLAGGQALAA